MQQENWFCVVSNHDWSVNENILFNIYLPIIKIDTMTFYKNLITFNNDSKTYNLHKFVEKCKMDENDFWKHLHKLEAVKLVNTYKFNDGQKNKYFIKLNSSLSFNEIMQEKDFWQLLELSLNEYDLNTIKEKFGDNLLLENLSDVSWNIHEVFNFKKNIQKTFHLNEIKQKIYEITNLTVEISNKVYEYLKYIFNNYDWTYEQIAKLLSNCIVDAQTSPHVSYLLMSMSFEEQINTFAHDNIEKNVAIFTDNLNVEIPEPKEIEYVELCRDENIYNNEHKLDEFYEVLQDFKKYDSIKYISSIHKEPLKQDCISFIESLHETYNFTDPIINVLFDYCIWKNKGYITIKYITKIAKTVYSLKINVVENLIQYLKNAKEYSKNKKNQVQSIVQQATLFVVDDEKDDDGFN